LKNFRHKKLLKIIIHKIIYNSRKFIIIKNIYHFKKINIFNIINLSFIIKLSHLYSSNISFTTSKCSSCFSIILNTNIQGSIDESLRALILHINNYILKVSIEQVHNNSFSVPLLQRRFGFSILLGYLKANDIFLFETDVNGIVYGLIYSGIVNKNQFYLIIAGKFALLIMHCFF